MRKVLWVSAPVGRKLPPDVFDHRVGQPWADGILVAAETAPDGCGVMVTIEVEDSAP